MINEKLQIRNCKNGHFEILLSDSLPADGKLIRYFRFQD